MNSHSQIHLLASGTNDCGDLFTRLNKDLFFSLGYDGLRLNVHKSGRELDLQGDHRFERRRVIAECKAHSSKIGGDDLNKFYGVLCRERRKSGGLPVTGYFISLNGFTETGIEQENETGNDRVILFDGSKIVEELERSRVVIDRASAAERAGHCAQLHRIRDIVIDGIELMAHSFGYLWVIFYASGKQRTHFVLIHADGTPLAKHLADLVVKADSGSRKLLDGLTYLAPQPPTPERKVLIQNATNRYRKWLAEECGYIQLDGLPADSDLASTRLKLEKLFVPLNFKLPADPGDHPDVQMTLRDIVAGIDEVLGQGSHLAVLASPGAGKSTLLKRLAIAYAFPERRHEVPDRLPNYDWLPVFLRCRELRERAHRPILELLNDIAHHAGLTNEEEQAFRDWLRESLSTGKILLLIDGLDEISEETARTAFATHLRTFVAMFPETTVIVTSREAGFRLVAGVVASVCAQLLIAPFNGDDVTRLCEAWHVEVVQDSPEVRADARTLAERIWENERIRPLAETPLLLTTLLVVKRWVGRLPEKRVILYAKAVEVLLATWNVEGFTPIDEEEALPQLCYLASWMMSKGVQRVTRSQLISVLKDARRELEAELYGARVSPHQFIDRIEYRSSLVMQVGEEINDGIPQAVYEFRHLTFQEYLAATAFIEGWYPGRESQQRLLQLLEPHFHDERWSEVIPLAVVRAKQQAAEIVTRLVEMAEVHDDSGRIGVLFKCFLDEAPLPSALVDRALAVMFQTTCWLENHLHLLPLATGRFGTRMYELSVSEFRRLPERFAYISDAVSASGAVVLGYPWKVSAIEGLAQKLQSMMRKGDDKEQITACLVFNDIVKGELRIAFDRGSDQHRRFVNDVATGCFECLWSESPAAIVAACWALGRLGEYDLWDIKPSIAHIEKLLLLMEAHGQKPPGGQACFAFSRLPLLGRDELSIAREQRVGSLLELLMALEKDAGENVHHSAATILAWYRRAPWNDQQLSELIYQNEHAEDAPFTRHLLESMGEAGLSILERWEKEKPKAR